MTSSQIMSEGFDFTEYFGEHGQLLVDACAAYNFAEDHNAYKIVMSGDWQLCCAEAYPLALHYGRFRAAYEVVDGILTLFEKAVEEFTPFDGECPCALQPHSNRKTIKELW